jgi:hypothetical protein
MKLFGKKRSRLTCQHCGRPLADELPALTFSEPAYWQNRDKNEKDNLLDSDFCVIKINGELHYFIRVTLHIPIIESDETLDWGVWVSQKKENIIKYRKSFDNHKLPAEAPYFGWLSNTLPTYPETLGLKTSVTFQERGVRPVITLEHSAKHPLCQEQHSGITLERAHFLVDTTLGRNKKET